MEKHGGLYLYDIDFEKRYSIDDKNIHSVKGDEYDLIGNPYNPYGTSTGYGYFAFMMTCLTES